MYANRAEGEDEEAINAGCYEIKSDCKVVILPAPSATPKRRRGSLPEEGKDGRKQKKVKTSVLTEPPIVEGFKGWVPGEQAQRVRQGDDG